MTMEPMMLWASEHGTAKLYDLGLEHNGEALHRGRTGPRGLKPAWSWELTLLRTIIILDILLSSSSSSQCGETEGVSKAPLLRIPYGEEVCSQPQAGAGHLHLPQMGMNQMTSGLSTDPCTSKFCLRLLPTKQCVPQSAHPQCSLRSIHQ